MLWICPLFLLLGLFTPGFFLARALRQQMWLASAFTLSLVVLFHSVFWLGIFHVRLTLWSVLPCLILVSATAAWLGRNAEPLSAPKPSPAWLKPDRILLASSAIIGLILFARMVVSPLIGFDTFFRWDFLAQKIFALGRFDFYPPLTPADFQTYFYVDGIPPMVSFTHWWLYSAAGAYVPSIISVFVAAQFAATLAFSYGAASKLYSPRAGVLAAALLAACPLYFRSVALGQETGLTALSIAAMVYFLVVARDTADVRAMVAAGLAASLCALSREYGWIALIAGVILLAWRRWPLSRILIFGSVATAAAAPWYIRNWILAGNPFYSLRFGGFSVNPIHDAIVYFYNARLGVFTWGAADWTVVLVFLITYATLQFLAGVPAGLKDFRRNGYLLVIAFLLIAVWLQSAGFTSGGVEISTRVLSPAMVVLSIAAAGMLDPFTKRERWKPVVLGGVLLLQVLTAGHGVLYPNHLFSLSPGQWGANAFQPVSKPMEFLIADQLAKILPAGSRVLSDNANLHASLIDKGFVVVPVWSPEVRFLFSASPEDSERQLRALHIDSAVVYPQSFNTAYLAGASPFYAALPQRWRVLAQTSMFVVVAPK